MISRIYWLKLKPETRKTLAFMLGIKKTGNTEVVDNRVVCDGYTDDELFKVQLKQLQDLVKSESVDFYELLDQAVRQIETIVDEVPLPEAPQGVEISSEPKDFPVIKKRGRKKKTLIK